MPSKRFQVLEEQSEILKKIAAQYARDSKEYLAVEQAAFALAFALTEDYERFLHFVQDCAEELTDEQKAHIKRLGLS